MIKWPEPALWIDTATHPHEIRYTPDVYCKDNPHYTKAQLKQAVRDVLTLTIQRLNGNTYNLTKAECVGEIRALIKEI